jgi:phosphoribosyl-ATP pyrophosphohydrolase/phosphoribosyl-AMP cyclohydrolase
MNIDWKKMNGIAPTVIQCTDGQVLTLCYSTPESLAKTIESGELWLFSRSRNRLARKGESSGNTQRVVDIKTDCDNDSLLIKVEQKGPACHTGRFSCFGDRDYSLASLYDAVLDRKQNPKIGSYTTSLFTDAKGATNKILEKLGEEMTELIIASKDGKKESIMEEMADLWYFCIVLLAEKDIPPSDIIRILEARRR